jgi:arylformamidase
VGRFIELGHVLEDGMSAYPGLPAPVFGAHLTHRQSRTHYDGKAEFYLGRVEMPCNVGTYLDAPFHRFPGRPDLAAVPLEAVAGLPGLVLDGLASDRGRAVGLDPAGADLAGRAVLVRTGWDERWGTPEYWQPGPFLSGAALDLLVASGPALVGVDFWNVDDTADPARPAHTRLLDAGILVVEHLCGLGGLPRDGFRFSAVPLRIVGGASFPVRAYAELPGRPD